MPDLHPPRPFVVISDFRAGDETGCFLSSLLVCSPTNLSVFPLSRIIPLTVKSAPPPLPSLSLSLSLSPGLSFGVSEIHVYM